MVTIEVGWVTDRGAVRPHNEDSVFVGQQLVAVADGMGGHAAGDVASAMATDAVRQLDGQHNLRPDDIVLALTAVSDAIASRAEREPERLGMGTTIAGVGIVVVGGSEHWAIFNVGDSRVYHGHEGELLRATTDHSEVEELVTAGKLTAEEARVHPNRNVITRSLGTVPAPQVDIRLIPTAICERFVVCSDGLVSELDDVEIATVSMANPVASGAASALLEAALARGARDNVSVIVLDSRILAETSPVLEKTLPRSQLGMAGSG